MRVLAGNLPDGRGWHFVAYDNGYPDDRCQLIAGALACLGLNLAIGGALEAAYTLGMYPAYWGSNVEGERAFGGRWPWPQ